MLTIYHAPLTRSIRIIWLCEELGIDYKIQPVDFSAEYRSTPEWRRMNPVGKVPVMTDGNLKLFESGAMLQYILDRYGNGRLQPETGSDDHGRFLQWCWFSEATFARPVGEIVNHRRAFAKGDRSEAVIQEMADRVQACCDALEEEFHERPFIVGGSFSAADIMLGYTLLLTDKVTPATMGPLLDEYWQRLQSRPAYTAATADV